MIFLGRRWARRAGWLLVPLVLSVQVQRGLAESHHNFDAPLTIEAPFALLPSDLALSAYPAVLDEPPQEMVLAALSSGSGTPAGTVPLERERARDAHRAAPDSPRAPPRG